jgi:hypothetical protein
MGGMMKNLLTKQAIINLIMASKGTTFATLQTSTTVKMNKTAVVEFVMNGEKQTEKVSNPYHGNITKASRVNVLLNGTYKNAMTKALRQIGELSDTEEYEPKQRAWGERVDGSAIIEHNGGFYLDCRPLHVYETEYFLNGSPINKKEFEMFMPKKKDSVVTSVSYKLDSIVEMNFNHETYKVA